MKVALATLSGSLQAAGLVEQTGTGSALSQLGQVLLRAGVAAPLVQEIVRAIADELSPRAQRDQLAVLDGGRRQLRRRVVTAGMFGAAGVSKDQAAAICLVGGTGVGKTTALTKLAAGLRDRYTVGLVTTDTYRLAAAAQLLAYCDILNLPAATAYTPAELPSSAPAWWARGWTSSGGYPWPKPSQRGATGGASPFLDVHAQQSGAFDG